MRRHAFLIVSACVLAACNRAPTPDDKPPAPASLAVPASVSVAMPVPATPASSPADSATPQMPQPMPEGSYANYQCDDGAQVEVHFNGIASTVVWPDGRTARLSQSATATEGQPQLYSNRDVRILRDADGLHLRDGRNAETLCTETASSA